MLCSNSKMEQPNCSKHGCGYLQSHCARKRLSERASTQRAKSTSRVQGLLKVAERIFCAKPSKLMGKPAFTAEQVGLIFSRYNQRALNAMLEHWRRIEFVDYQRIVRDSRSLEEEMLKCNMTALVVKNVSDEWG